MARLPRLRAAGHLHLVVWRGHNGQPVVADDTDAHRLLDAVAELAAREGVAWHGFALLPNEVWLLLTPATDGALGRLMQGVGRRYVRLYNDRHGRRGTLWEGRYRAAVLAPPWALPALVLLDTLPLEAGLCAQPEHHPWSSHRHYSGMQMWRGLQPPPAWWALGDTPFAREAAYRQRVAQGLTSSQRDALRRAALHGWPLGDDAFLAALQASSGRRVQPARPGRPRKGSAPNDSVPK